MAKVLHKMPLKFYGICGKKNKTNEKNMNCSMHNNACLNSLISNHNSIKRKEEELYVYFFLFYI